MELTALIVAVALLIPALWAARKGLLRRIAWRNVTSRPTEALLVTAGTMLGTAIIVASFVVGDTIEAGVGSVVETSLGPIDESVTIDDPARLSDLELAILAADVADVDGVISVLSLPTAVTTVGSDPLGQPNVWIAEIDFDRARAFGGDPASGGFADAGPTPVSGEAVVISRVARQLNLEVGDQIAIHAFGNEIQVEVRQVIDRYSAAGFNSVYLAPGTIEDLTAGIDEAGPTPRAEVLVSNTGDFTTGADLTETVTTALETATAGFDGVEVESRKVDVLDTAVADGAEFTTLFSGIGSFAVIAGILLIVNLFVMLAEERKTSLGIMRAIGFQRKQVSKSFAIEGAVYSLTASMAGVAIGVGIGWVLVQVLKSIFFSQNDFLTIGFEMQPESLMLAAAIGLGITMVTIWFTAYRISKFNVIAAVRDLPQPATKKGKVKGVIFGVLGMVAGVGVLWLGMVEEIPSAAVAGLPIMAFSAMPILRLIIGERFAGIVAGAVSMVWGISVFGLYPEVMADSDIDVFVVQGVVLVAGAVIISASMSNVWAWMVNVTGRFGAGLSSRLGLVYPLARRGRTGLLLGMFSLVIFTITFLSVFAQILDDQTQGLADDSRAGYDIMADSSEFNPATAAMIGQVDGVGQVAPIILGGGEFEIEGDDPRGWRITGFDETLLALDIPSLASRLDGYETDRAVFEAVLADPTLIIIDDFFLDDGSGIGSELREPGETVRLVPQKGEPVDLTVAGVMSSDWVFAGSYMSGDFVRETLDGQTGRFYLSGVEGVDAETIASRLNAQLIEFGMDAETFVSNVEAEVAETLGIFRLFQGFLSLGLLIGIAGLSVVLVRAVHERRRAIGVLRALGTDASVVRRSFLVEAAFVAVQGVVIGAVLGLLTAYQVIVESSTFGDADLQFAWPWVGLTVALIVPTIAALLAASIPAKRASAITPAVALRTD